MQFHQTFFVLIAIAGIVVSLVNSKVVKDDVLFRRLGTYKYGRYEKTFWFPRHIKSQWHLARPICKAHGLELLIIDTLDEWKHISQLCEANKDLFGSFTHINGVASNSKSSSDWFWLEINEKVAYDMPWQRGQPDFNGNNEWCLTLAKDDGFKFNDIPCYGSWEERFICESIREVDGVGIETDFRGLHN